MATDVPPFTIGMRYYLSLYVYVLMLTCAAYLTVRLCVPLSAFAAAARCAQVRPVDVLWPLAPVRRARVAEVRVLHSFAYAYSTTTLLIYRATCVYSALFLTKEEIASATNTLASYRNGGIAPGQMTDAELWHARRGEYTHKQPYVIPSAC